MLFSKKNRARVDHGAGCDCCNANVAPRFVKKHRRAVKRRERNTWKKEETT